MSVRVMSLVFEADIKEVKINQEKTAVTPPTMKLVLLALADHASDTGESVYPSLETISRKTGLSIRSIQRATDALEKIKLVKIIGWSKVGTLSYSLNVKELGKYAHDSESSLNMTQSHPKHDSESSESSVNHQFNLNDNEQNPVSIASVYESEIGMLSPMISDKITEAEKDYPQSWIIKAIDIAVNNNARNWNYIEACLKNMKSKGVDWKPNGNGKKSAPTEPGLFAVLREMSNDGN